MAKGCKTKVMRETRRHFGWVVWILAAPDFPRIARLGPTYKTRKQARDEAREFCRKRGY